MSRRLPAIRFLQRWRQSVLQRMDLTSSPPETGRELSVPTRSLMWSCRHVKFWYLEYSRSAKYKEPVPLMGRSAILGEQRNNYFCDVGCGRGEMVSDRVVTLLRRQWTKLWINKLWRLRNTLFQGDSTYAITKSGLLCEFNNRRLLDKWVELRTTRWLDLLFHFIFIRIYFTSHVID